jgi:hypothetical protein
LVIEELASYRRCCARLASTWPAFQKRRRDHLVQAQRYGHAPEKAAENIVADLFTQALDWSVSDINFQVEYADMVLTRLGVKHLVVEVKRPGAFAWQRRGVEAALSQAADYAARQEVLRVAVSDGQLFYAADLAEGGLRDRVFVRLHDPQPPYDLWWVSVHGIYRRRQEMPGAVSDLLGTPSVSSPDPVEGESRDLLNPKYRLPWYCFAYVGDASNPRTWHLPYRLADGSVDVKRLPKAIAAILSNYRGAQVSSVPEPAIPAVLERLAAAAREVDRMPDQDPSTASVYCQLENALRQCRRPEKPKPFAGR